MKIFFSSLGTTEQKTIPEPEVIHTGQAELERIANLPRFQTGYTNILGAPFKFHDGLSFVVTHKDIFHQRIYEFNSSPTRKTIIDCGANMGLSVIFFATIYPNHQILAFEPDEELFKLLQENVRSFNLSNVVLEKKGIWEKKERLTFYTDGGMGGRVLNPYIGQEPQFVDVVPLSDYLNEDVDFLKIDIEGAEDTVLRSCKGKLKLVRHLFFEYHNNVHSNQTLHELLLLIKEEGFHYYIKESGTRVRPFTDEYLICDDYDMALNIFCYPEKQLD